VSARSRSSARLWTSWARWAMTGDLRPRGRAGQGLQGNSTAVGRTSGTWCSTPWACSSAAPRSRTPISGSSPMSVG
jgi:hypothetical protein